METKHLIAFIGILCAGFVSSGIQLLSLRARGIAFFLIVTGATLTERMDVNFLGEYWYRGTTRGIEISLIDTIMWGLLIASTLSPREERRRWIWPASTGLILVYFAYCVVSVVNAPQPRFGLWELASIPRALLFLLTGAMYVRGQRELRILVLGFCVSIIIEFFFSIKQHFLMGIARVPGTLDHANSLSMYLCTVGPVCLAATFCAWPAWLRWTCGASWAAAGVLEMMTFSRAGIPSFGVVSLGVAIACSTWRITRTKIVAVATMSAVFGIVGFKLWPYMSARYASASLAEEYIDVNGENRGVYWRWAWMMVEDYPYGVGLNNWSYAVSKSYGYRLGFWYEDYDEIKVAPEKADLPSILHAPPAHSLVALTIGELGWVGLILFSLVWLRWFQLGLAFLVRRLNPAPMHRIGIGILFGTVGMFLHSITEWTYRQSTMLMTFHLMMGVLASLYYARRHASAPVAETSEAFEEIEMEAVPIHVSAAANRS